jgi:plasmid segregation protein ParM
MRVAGLDLGRRTVKIFTGSSYVSFPAVVGEWRELKLKNDYGSKAFDCRYKGDSFFVGTLAENESEFYRQMLIEDKATHDALLLALVALHQTDLTDVDIVTGLPVSIHDDKNKEALINLLTGMHDVEVNGTKKVINIHRVRVAVEGGGAFWSEPKDGMVRIIDGGSKTINYVTMNNRKYVDRDSGTLLFGFDTNKSSDYKQMANRIAGELGRKWDKMDLVFTVGGRAEELADSLKNYYPRIQPFQTRRMLHNGEEVDLNMFANAVGYFNIGRAL